VSGKSELGSILGTIQKKEASEAMERENSERGTEKQEEKVAMRITGKVGGD